MVRSLLVLSGAVSYCFVECQVFARRFFDFYKLGFLTCTLHLIVWQTIQQFALKLQYARAVLIYFSFTRFFGPFCRRWLVWNKGFWWRLRQIYLWLLSLLSRLAFIVWSFGWYALVSFGGTLPQFSFCMCFKMPCTLSFTKHDSLISKGSGACFLTGRVFSIIGSLIFFVFERIGAHWRTLDISYGPDLLAHGYRDFSSRSYMHGSTAWPNSFYL